MRAVVDTNILIRALLKPQGTVAPVLGRLRQGGYVLLYSTEILEEIADVLGRPIKVATPAAGPPFSS